MSTKHVKLILQLLISYPSIHLLRISSTYKIHIKSNSHKIQTQIHNRALTHGHAPVTHKLSNIKLFVDDRVQHQNVSTYAV